MILPSLIVLLGLIFVFAIVLTVWLLIVYVMIRVIAKAWFIGKIKTYNRVIEKETKRTYNKEKRINEKN